MLKPLLLGIGVLAKIAKTRIGFGDFFDYHFRVTPVLHDHVTNFNSAQCSEVVCGAANVDLRKANVCVVESKAICSYNSGRVPSGPQKFVQEGLMAIEAVHDHCKDAHSMYAFDMCKEMLPVKNFIVAAIPYFYDIALAENKWNGGLWGKEDLVEIKEGAVDLSVVHARDALPCDPDNDMNSITHHVSVLSKNVLTFTITEHQSVEGLEDIVCRDDWMKIKVYPNRDYCYICALVPGLTDTEVLVGFVASGELCLSGRPKQGKPSIVGSFHEKLLIPGIIDQISSEAEILPNGRLIVRVPFQRQS